MILPALLLALDEYSSWRVGGGGGFAQQSGLPSVLVLLRSDLVAELNPTVIDM